MFIDIALPNEWTDFKTIFHLFKMSYFVFVGKNANFLIITVAVLIQFSKQYKKPNYKSNGDNCISLNPTISELFTKTNFSIIKLII